MTKEEAKSMATLIVNRLVDMTVRDNPSQICETLAERYANRGGIEIMSALQVSMTYDLDLVEAATLQEVALKVGLVKVILAEFMKNAELEVTMKELIDVIIDYLFTE